MPSTQQATFEATETGSRRAVAALRRSGALAWLQVMAGNGVYIALGFACNVVVANGLGPAAYGTLAIAMAVMLVLQELAGSGLDLAMVRLAAQHAATDPARAQRIFRAGLYVKLAVSAAVMALAWLCAGPVARGAFGDPELAGPLRWAAVGVLGGALHGWVLARFQADEHFRHYALFRSVNNALKLAALGGLWLAGALTLDAVLAVSVGVFFVAYGVGLPFLPRAQDAAPPGALAGAGRDVLRFGRWIVASHLLFALYSRVDLLMIGRLLTPEDAAFYAVAWNFSFPIDLCTYAVILAMLPRVARLTTRAEYVAETRRIFALCAAIAVALLPLFFLAEPSIRLLFPGYAASAEIFRVLFLGPLVTVLVHPLYLILYARNRVAMLTAVDLVLVVACAAGCLVWIPAYGTIGAAWATVAARVVNCLLVLGLVVLELRALAREPAAPPAPAGR
ncbi:MAG: hypothetical protein DCC71_04115 [Proteobacteria bacterium]|nr:MAG: hypothetical protein DCC71_04115 [Pseudomonadota bacterium]